MFTTVPSGLGPGKSITHTSVIHEGEQCPKATNFHPIHATSGSRSFLAAPCSRVPPASSVPASSRRAATTTTLRRRPPMRLPALPHRPPPTPPRPPPPPPLPRQEP